MAIKPSVEYSNATPADAAYPYGSFKNSDTPTSRNGTPLEKAWPNDIYGFLQALLTEASVVPTGEPDTAVASQYLTAMQTLFASAAQGAKADTALQPGEAVIVGEIRAFAFQTPPAKWLEFGQTVSRTTYSALFAAIGTTWGVGDGATTFDLPPRGYFMRSWDHGAGVDPDRAFGSIQEDAMQPITGTINSANSAYTNVADGAFSVGTDTATSAGDTSSGVPVTEFDSSTQVRTANETRPKNIAVLECIYAGV